MQPEASFKKALVNSFKKAFPEGWYAYTKSVTRQGMPDLRFSRNMDGYHRRAWVEAKVAPNKLSAIQSRELCRMARAAENIVVLTLVGAKEDKKDQSIRIEHFDYDGNVHSPFLISWALLPLPSFWDSVLSV